MIEFELYKPCLAGQAKRLRRPGILRRLLRFVRSEISNLKSWYSWRPHEPGRN
jgi:hypothetical protein